MAKIVFTDQTKSVRIAFNDKKDGYGFKELDIPKNSTSLIVEDDKILSFYLGGQKKSIDYNDVDTPQSTSASDLRDKVFDFFFV